MAKKTPFETALAYLSIIQNNHRPRRSTWNKEQLAYLYRRIFYRINNTAIYQPKKITGNT